MIHKRLSLSLEIQEPELVCWLLNASLPQNLTTIRCMEGLGKHRKPLALSWTWETFEQR